MASWKVVISKKAQLEFLALKKSRELSSQDQEVIRAWTVEITLNGVENIIGSKKWNDHALQGRWAGYRSSSFSFKGRIIYKIEGNQVLVKVVRITVDHNYSKGEQDG
jgi:mRNA-degrading endonuclease YafQ of YafQ-DinJ toxin-antitoxin module